jgi:hypothetical protein
VVLASNLTEPWSLAVDAVNVYWATMGPDAAGTGQIQSVPIGGGSAKTIVTGLELPSSLAVDTVNVYFTDMILNVVGYVPLGGASVPTTLAANQPQPYQLALSDGVLYWATGTGNIMGSILSLPVAGGTLKTAVGPVSYLEGPLATATTLYWDDSTGIQSMPLGGGPVTTLGIGPLMEPRSFAIGPTALTWCIDGTIYTTPLAGGATTTLATTDLEGIAVDEANVYWTGSVGYPPTSGVFKAPVSGGPVTMIASAYNSPMAIVADATSVYWIEVGAELSGGTPSPGQPVYMPGTGAVMKIAK